VLCCPRHWPMISRISSITLKVQLSSPLYRTSDGLVVFKLGSVANQEMINSHTFNSKTDEQFKQEMVDERACREAERDTDRASWFQSNVMPEFGDDLVGFHIEFCFSYNAYRMAVII
jgi:hypothetical protein